MSQQQPFRLAGLSFTGMFSVIAGGVCGSIINAINGIISPDYFIAVLHWEPTQSVYPAIIAQGLFEGLLYGVIFGLFLVFFVAKATRGRVAPIFIIRLIFKTLLGIVCCWGLGGVMGIMLAALSPEFFRSTFIGVPALFVQMLKYAWVGGAIWGAIIGALFMVAIMPFRLRSMLSCKRDIRFQLTYK